MSRRKRTLVEGLTAHVTNRGNNKMATFRAESDYDTFLWFLRFAITKYKLHVHSYALMSNHFHLMMTPETATGLSRGMQCKSNSSRLCANPSGTASSSASLDAIDLSHQVKRQS
jgi:putative transposase